MTENIVEAELATFFSAILGDRINLQGDGSLGANLGDLVKDLSAWSELFTVCPNCNHLFLMCPWCETLISCYDEFCEHGFACLGAEKL